MFNMPMVNASPENRPESWDERFRSGKLSYLHQPDELVRLREIAAMCGQFASAEQKVEIADIGSGEGLLARYLDPQKIARYVAIDVSGEALARISDLHPDVVTVRAGLGEWDGKPEPRYPRVLVASEVLYYVPDGVEQLKVLAHQEGAAGIIVSCVSGRPDKPNWTASSRRLWTELATTGWQMQARRRVATPRNAWDITAYRV